MSSARRLTIRGGSAARALPAAGWAGFLLIGVAMVTSDPDPDASTRGLGFLLILGGTVLLFRTVRAGIVLTTEGVKVKGLLRNRVIPWNQIESVGIGDGGTVLPWRVLVIHTNLGEHEVPEVAQLRTGGAADRAVAAVESWPRQ